MAQKRQKSNAVSLVKILNISSCLMMVVLAFNIHSLAAQLTQSRNDVKKESKKAIDDSKKSTVTGMSHRSRLQGWNLVNGVEETELEDKDSKGEIGGDDDTPDQRVELAETELRKDLGEHKKSLESHAEAIAQQQKDLSAEQKKLNDELKALVKNNSELSNKQEKRKEDIEAGINRMAHVFEQMPPKDAAGMFNVLDMRVMVPVAQHMIPRKVSDIMGNMDPDRANTLSQYLAGIRQLSDDAVLKLNSKADYPISSDR